jgi:LmbE family N-acetylglucosaminyl deacetylase
MSAATSSSALRILVVAPHADDETLGAGGTIARRAAEGHEVHVAVVTDQIHEPHAMGPRSVRERSRAEAQRAIEVLGVHHLHFVEVPAVVLADPSVWDLDRTICALIEKIQPDVLYAPFPFDLHKGHCEVFHALSVAWRSTAVGRKVRAIFCYEVQSQTRENAPHVAASFTPNAWIDVSAHLDTKMRALACYESQLRPAPDARSIEAVRALAVWRGSQHGMAAAEAFMTIRLLE